MCILSYLPPHTEVDVDGLVNGGISNPDGHGWAIAADDKMIMGRSLELEDAIDKFVIARARYMDSPALFHSRWATHGTVRLDNTHPFMVGGSHKTVVAHNGILPWSAHPNKGDDRSDTRKFADEILPSRFRQLDRVEVQKQLANWCGTSNKLVILTVDPRYRSSAYLVNQAMGEWDSTTGLWHSNGDYREPFGRWYTTPAKGAVVKESASATPFKSAADSAAVFGDADPTAGWDCQFCGVGEIGRSGYCGHCWICNDCNAHINDCQCYDYENSAPSMVGVQA